MKKIGQIYIGTNIPKLMFFNLVCMIMYIKGIQYINLVQIGLVFAEIQGVENGKLAVPVNNKLVCSTSFLAVTHDHVP